MTWPTNDARQSLKTIFPHFMKRLAGRLNDRLPPGSLGARMARGTFWSLCGAASFQASSLAISVLSARILHVHGFGEFALLRSTILLFGILAGSGLGVVATKYVAEHRDSAPETAGSMIAFLLRAAHIAGGMVSVACFAFSAPLANGVMQSEGLVIPLRIGSLLLWINSVQGLQYGVLSGLESFKALSGIAVWDALFNLLCIPLGAFFYGVPGAAGGAVLAAAAGYPIRHAILARECRRRKIVLKVGKGIAYRLELVQSVLPSVLLGMVFYPFEWTAKLFLTRSADGFTQLGVFAVAQSLCAMVSYGPTQLMATTQALLGNLLANRDMQGFKSFARYNMLMAGGAAAAVALILSLGAGVFMRAYGVQIEDAARVLIVLATAHVFYALVIPYYKIAVACSRMWMQAFFTTILGVVLVTATHFFSSLGALGLSMSYLAAWLAMFLAESVYMRRLMQTMR